MLKEFFQKIKNKFRELKMGKGNTMQMSGKLYAKRIPWDDSVTVDLGMVSNNCVTSGAAVYLVDSFQDSSTGGAPMDLFYFHGYGDSTGAEATGDTALGAEIGTRSTGTQEETSSMVFKTVATLTATGAHAITEHGLFSSSTSTTLWDRSLFAAINVTSGDSIEFTYELEVSPGG